MTMACCDMSSQVKPLSLELQGEPGQAPKIWGQGCLWPLSAIDTTGPGLSLDFLSQGPLHLVQLASLCLAPSMSIFYSLLTPKRVSLSSVMSYPWHSSRSWRLFSMLLSALQSKFMSSQVCGSLRMNYRHGARSRTREVPPTHNPTGAQHAQLIACAQLAVMPSLRCPCLGSSMFSESVIVLCLSDLPSPAS